MKTQLLSVDTVYFCCFDSPVLLRHTMEEDPVQCVWASCFESLKTISDIKVCMETKCLTSWLFECCRNWMNRLTGCLWACIQWCGQWHITLLCLFKPRKADLFFLHHVHDRATSVSGAVFAVEEWIVCSISTSHSLWYNHRTVLFCHFFLYQAAIFSMTYELQLFCNKTIAEAPAMNVKYLLLELWILIALI